MKRRGLISKNKTYSFLFVTLFLDSYRFFAVGKRDITIWYIGAALIFFMALISPTTIIQGIKRNPWSAIMPIYMIINFLIVGESGTTSIYIGLLCWLFYVFSFRRSTINQFMKTVGIFQKGMNIFAIYGIYQFIANLFGLPLSSLWIEGIMVDGYNWGNTIKIAGFVLRRSNGIFREPSYFSQFLAMNILIYFVQIINHSLSGIINERKAFVRIIINGVALILTFSGTGLLLLVSSAIILMLINNPMETRKFIRKHSISLALAVIAIIMIMAIPNPVTKYFLSRTSEFDYTNIHSISGYLRMILPYQAAIEVITLVNPLFGLGIGNATIYRLVKNGMYVGYSIQPIIPRTFVEEGLIGGIILFFFTIKTWNKKNIRILPAYTAILIGTYMMSFMHGTWSSEVFWLFLGFLNVELIPS